MKAEDHAIRKRAGGGTGRWEGHVKGMEKSERGWQRTQRTQRIPVAVMGTV